MAKKNYQLHLKGYVGGWDFDADYVDYILSKNADSHVDVLIDSTGGYVGTALSVAAAFRRHGDVSVHFVGLNASAATIASLGAKHISIDKAAMYLVHKCSTTFFKWASLNSDQYAELIKDMEKTMEDLDKFDQNAARQYASRCKRKPEDMLALMAKGGWLTAQEALEWGFVDEITDLEEDENTLQVTEALVEAMASNGMPLPQNFQITKENKNSAFNSFLKMLSSAFRSKEDNNTGNPTNAHDNNNVSMKKLALLCAVLAIEALKLENGKVDVTEEQLDKIEAALSDRDSKISDLTNQIEDQKKKISELEAKLDQKPGAETSQVTENSKGAKEESDEKSDVEEYVEAYNNAKEFLKSIR